MLTYKKRRRQFFVAWKPMAKFFAVIVAIGLAADLKANADSKSTEPGGAASPFDFVDLPSSPAREGYVTLSWEPYEAASRYEVVDGGGKVIHSGVFPQAFISGLSDGEYRYRVRAVNASGEILVQSASTATIEVSHWPAIYVWPLLGVGFFVVAAVVFVIVAGERWASTEEMSR
ncbi:fibronectin type III domain-containing protein [Roseiconus lacunae]|uniref:hypothetical protein n=1 Tax=Roseiconus lacunae TaxID=2605694 RepID=UPI00308FEFAC|nr:fibronectin type III domain-containing protein [Stieleria sp. HD01]